MNVEVTLTLPNALVEHAKQMGHSTQRRVEDVLVDTLKFTELLWPLLENLPTPTFAQDMTGFSNQEILALASLTMDEIQDKRLETLQTKGKQTDLSEAERYELMALMQIYQIGQLRKSEGLVEAVRRGLRPPLAP